MENAVMKKGLLLMALFGAVCIAPSVLAQATPPTDNVPPTVTPPLDTKPPEFDKPPEGRPFIPERPVTIPRPTPPDGAPAGAGGSTANQPQLPQDVKDLVKQFQQDREAFLAEQKKLAKEIKDSTAEERAALREKMRENLDKWREAQSEFRKNLKDMIESMKNNLQQDLRRNVEQGAKEGGRK